MRAPRGWPRKTGRDRTRRRPRTTGRRTAGSGLLAAFQVQILVQVFVALIGAASGLVAGAGLADAALHLGAALARRLAAGIQRVARGIHLIAHLAANGVDGVADGVLDVAHLAFPGL